MVLTVDPGISKLGFAVFEDDILIWANTYEFEKGLSQEQRLYQIFLILSTVTRKYNITDIVAESQFVQIMGNIVGVIRAVAGFCGAKCTLYNPLEWKKAATGRGKIPEDELRQFVEEKYPQVKDAPDDTIDAVGIYIGFKNKQGNTNVSKSPKKTKRK